MIISKNIYLSGVRCWRRKEELWTAGDKGCGPEAGSVVHLCPPPEHMACSSLIYRSKHLKENLGSEKMRLYSGLPYAFTLRQNNYWLIIFHYIWSVWVPADTHCKLCRNLTVKRRLREPRVVKCGSTRQRARCRSSFADKTDWNRHIGYCPHLGTPNANCTQIDCRPGRDIIPVDTVTMCADVVSLSCRLWSKVWRRHYTANLSPSEDEVASAYFWGHSIVSPATDHLPAIRCSPIQLEPRKRLQCHWQHHSPRWHGRWCGLPIQQAVRRLR